MKKTMRALAQLAVVGLTAPMMAMHDDHCTVYVNNVIYVAQNHLCRGAGFALLLTVGGVARLFGDGESAVLCAEMALELYREKK